MIHCSHSFNRGDTVRVCNSLLKTYRKVGRVLDVYDYTVEVQFDDLPTLRYNASNLTLVGREEKSNNKIDRKVKENSDMSVIGNYEVVLVKFIQGTNTTKKYAFALFDNSVNVGDTILVDTSNGYNVAVITEIHSKSDYEELGCSLPSREVICKIDFTAFDERKAKRARADKLKKDMNNIVKSLQEIAVFELLAEKSPELRVMLDEYKVVME